MNFKKYNYALNGLRGICILMILIFHVENSRLMPSGEEWDYVADLLRYFVQTLKYGVEIFFMISGYVIIASLRRHKTLLGFFRDRVIRIYPTWIPLHILSFIGGPLLARGIFETYDPTLWTFSFFTNLFFLTPVLPYPTVHPPTWSLCYEWVFYFTSGLFVFIMMQHKKAFKIIACVLFLILILLLLNYFPRALFFLPGVVLALYKPFFDNYEDYFKFPVISMIAFLIAWGATDIEYAERAVAGEQVINWLFDGRIVYAIIALLAGFYSFACIVYSKGAICRLLCHPIMQFYGNISYAFYLWSPVAMLVARFAVEATLLPFIGIWPTIFAYIILSLILSTIISYLNWLYIEKKFTSYVKSRWIDKK